MRNRRKQKNIEYYNRVKKRNIWKPIALVMFVATIFVYYEVYVLYRYTMGKHVTEKQMFIYKWMAQNINFSKETEVEGEEMVDIGIIGNITIPSKIINHSLNNNDEEFNKIFKNVELSDYDYTIASLNTTVNQGNYGSNKTTDNLFKSVKKVGIDLLVTSTENFIKEEKSSVEATIDDITKNDLKYVGLKEKDKKSYYIIEKNNIRIAVLAYAGKEHAKSSRNDLVNVYSQKQMENDLKKIKDEKVDAIILFIDTLRNDKGNTSKEKKELLEKLLDKDVNIVISNDTIVQEYYKIANRKYVVCSLGDFIGNQEEYKSDVSKLLKVTIRKKMSNKDLKMEIDLDYDKTFVALSNQDKDKYKIVDIDKELNNYKGNISDNITPAEYNYLKELKESNK